MSSNDPSSLEPQPTAGDSEPVFDCQWNSSYILSDRSADGNREGQFQFSLQYFGSAGDDPTITDLIGNLSIDPDLPDSRATWHRNYTPLTPWIRAHVLKQAMGWNGEKQLANHFETHPELTTAYGFIDDDLPKQPKRKRASPPTQSRLWEMWHEEFDDDLRNIYREVATDLVEVVAVTMPSNTQQNREQFRQISSDTYVYHSIGGDWNGC